MTYQQQLLGNSGTMDVPRVNMADYLIYPIYAHDTSVGELYHRDILPKYQLRRLSVSVRFWPRRDSVVINLLAE
jgi:hypothetical protein